MITFEQPKVVYKQPNMETFVAFLQSEGWTVEEKRTAGYIMRAPDHKGVKQDYTYRLPTNKESRSFNAMAYMAVETFADLYKIPLQELFDLLSLSIEEIKKEVEEQPKKLSRQKAILANAS